MSERYDSFYRTSLVRERFVDLRVEGWPRNRSEAILAHAGKGRVVLDVGCGNGQLLYHLRERFERLMGIEYSAHRLAQAKLNLEGLPAALFQGSAEAMTEIPSDSVDCIVSADTIEHIPDVYAAAAELRRVLEPGGRLVINTPNVAFVKKRLMLLLGRFPSTSQPNEGLGSDVLFDGGHLHYFTYRSLALLLERAGFSIERAVGYGKLGRLHHLHPPLTSVGVQLVAFKPE